MRKFEFVNRMISTGYEMREPGINLPIRKTKYSAGYDIEAAEDTIIPAYKSGIKPTLVKTGVKALMQDDEVLLLYNRSSNPKKKNLILANGVGVIDKDYYGNPDNDGEIMFAFYNIGDEDITIKKGEAIGQGIFQKYLITDNDNSTGERIGGFGSTDTPKEVQAYTQVTNKRAEEININELLTQINNSINNNLVLNSVSSIN
nr:MAG TPA: deoxyuridine 5'-triphosphate nucleotidohydrolase [Caudoviricetes sp.]